jgi:hypothetical protein
VLRVPRRPADLEVNGLVIANGDSIGSLTTQSILVVTEWVPAATSKRAVSPGRTEPTDDAINEDLERPDQAEAAKTRDVKGRRRPLHLATEEVHGDPEDPSAPLLDRQPIRA